MVDMADDASRPHSDPLPEASSGRALSREGRGFAQVTSNTMYQVAGKGVQIATVLVTTGILTRSLGTAQFGQYKLLMTLMLLTASLADWGTGFIGTREAARQPEKQSELFLVLLVFRWGLATVAGVGLILGGAGWFQFPVRWLLPVVSLLLLSSVRTSCQIIFQARLKMQNLAIAEAVSSLTFLGLMVVAGWWWPLNLERVLWWLVVAAAVTDGVAVGLLGRLRPRLAVSLRRVDWLSIKWLLRESLPMGALLVTFSVYNKLDILLLKHFQGDVAVGYYSLAYSVHDNLVMGAAFFMNSVFPILSRQSGGQSNLGSMGPGFLRNDGLTPEVKPGRAVARTFTTAWHLAMVGGVLVSVGFFLGAPWVIAILGGSEFAPAVAALRILTVATLVAYLNHVTGFTLVALGKQAVSLRVAVGALGFNLMANWIFIPMFSYRASAVITILTEGLVLGLTAGYLTRQLKLSLGWRRLPGTVRKLMFDREGLF
jgi:O-antigen/teichoic acid export membrane protein